METEAGGWTIVQKRFSGLVDFDQTWKEYKMVSFGSERERERARERWVFSTKERAREREAEIPIALTMMEWSDEVSA